MRDDDEWGCGHLRPGSPDDPIFATSSPPCGLTTPLRSTFHFPVSAKHQSDSQPGGSDSPSPLRTTPRYTVARLARG